MYVDLKRLLVTAEVVLVITLLFLAIWSRGGIPAEFRVQASAAYDYCHTDKDAEEHQKSKECQGLIYKTFDDPVALFTGALVIATIALFVVTLGLFQAALGDSRNKEKLFVLERRPWIKVSIVIQETEFHDAGIRIPISMNVKNIGLTPAGEVNRGWFMPTFGTLETRRNFFQSRDDAKKSMDNMGRTLFPGEDAEIGGDLDISLDAEQAERQNPMEPLCVPIACFYKSLENNQIYETSRVYAIVFRNSSLRRARDANRSRRLLEAYSEGPLDEPSIQTRQVGMFDITT